MSHSEKPLHGSVVARFAVFGDAEPKPNPDFIYLSEAVDTINSLSRQIPIDFVASVGDIAHRGTDIQYSEATKHITRLEIPFLAIKGNEEYGAGISKFLDYAAQWNDTPELIPSPSFSHVLNGMKFIFATANNKGLDFTDEDIDWLITDIERSPVLPTILFTHPPAPDVFPNADDKSIENPRFAEILSHPRLIAVFSGHLHLNLNRVTHYIVVDGVHHIHAPGLERTKVPDDDPESHVPYFRLVTIFDTGQVLVETYDLAAKSFDQRHEIRFNIGNSPFG